MLRRVINLIAGLFGHDAHVTVKDRDSAIEAAAQVVAHEQADLRRRADDLGVGVDNMSRDP